MELPQEDKKGYDFAAAAAARERRMRSLKERLGNAVLGGIVINAMQNEDHPVLLFKTDGDAGDRLADLGFALGPADEPAWAVNMNAELLRLEPLAGGRLAIAETVDPHTMDPFWVAAMAEHTQDVLSR
jgi:hypothetical protein